MEKLKLYLRRKPWFGASFIVFCCLIVTIPSVLSIYFLFEEVVFTQVGLSPFTILICVFLGVFLGVIIYDKTGKWVDGF